MTRSRQTAASPPAGSGRAAGSGPGWLFFFSFHSPFRLYPEACRSFRRETGVLRSPFNDHRLFSRSHSHRRRRGFPVFVNSVLDFLNYILAWFNIHRKDICTKNTGFYSILLYRYNNLHHFSERFGNYAQQRSRLRSAFRSVTAPALPFFLLGVDFPAPLWYHFCVPPGTKIPTQGESTL